MASSKKSAPSNAELEAMFEGIGGDDDNTNNNNTSSTTSQETTKKPTPTSSNDAEEDDPLAELKTLAAAPRTSTSSRPNTPHLASSATTSVRGRSPATHSTNIYTPTTGSGRSSEEKAAAEAEAARQGADSQRILRAPQAPTSLSQQAEEQGQGGSWWGGFTSFASAAVKQGQAALQEIQRNEEAQRWAEQMKGIRGLGGQLSSRALPTFTNILHTLAPPISQHERLQIHITHDFVNYPSLDPLIYSTFSRVMSQVEGGDLMVIQQGSESGQKRSEGYTGGGLGSSNGWSDGPWWRENDRGRDLGAVKGIVEGTKLVRASAEAYGHDFFAARGGVEEAAKQAAAVLSEDNPTRSSDIFLAIQAIHHSAEKELFAANPSKAETSEGEKVVIDEEEKPEELVSFAIYLHDPIHSIAFSGLSQAFPQRWADWLDAKIAPSENDEDSKMVPQLPEEILEIIENDGVDPREWVAEWMEEVLGLAVGVVAQRYVARRMGVGEGGIGRGKKREVAVESNAGELARAL